jgi:hypothetical protein
VVVWNRGADKCEALKAEFGDFVTVAASPAEVLAATFPPQNLAACITLLENYDYCTPLAPGAKLDALTIFAAVPRFVEVVVACATTYCMLSTLEASEAVFPSVLEAVAPGKAIIDCATLNPERWDTFEKNTANGLFLKCPMGCNYIRRITPFRLMFPPMLLLLLFDQLGCLLTQ